MRVLLLCHYGRTGYNILRALRSLGAVTYAMIDDRSRSLRYSRACKVVYHTQNIDMANQDKVVQIINDLHDQEGLDSVIASEVESLSLLSHIRDRIRAPIFPLADLTAINALNNKWDFYKLCCAASVTVPKTLFFPADTPLAETVIEQDLGFPAIVKPVAGYGQRGITILKSRGDIAPIRSDHGGVIVQQYVEGVDWSLSVFAKDGEIKHWTAWECPNQLNNPTYGKLRFLITEFHERCDLFNMGQRIIGATNFSGVANFDARLDRHSGVMKMFECNPRFFNRMGAARICGLDFVAAGLLPERKQMVCLGTGHYYPWQELFTTEGVRLLLNGQWKAQALLRDVYEMVTDPLPPFVRNMTREDAKQ